MICYNSLMKPQGAHSFIICAYKEIPYLEECVQSLLNQTMKSEVLISTSTPNDFIKKIAKKYGVKLVINTGKKGHIEDFCFAYKQVNTKYVTLCHQDDIYYPDFAEKIVHKMNKYKRPLIGFANYDEIRNGKTVKHSSLLYIKRIMNFPLTFLGQYKPARLLNLAFGNAICAPTVTYNKELLDYPIKKSDFSSNIDWDTYDEFARMNGAFVYVPKALLGHRIHSESTTSHVIQDKTKAKEDLAMFERYWPKRIARQIVRLYGISEKNNDL